MTSHKLHPVQEVSFQEASEMGRIEINNVFIVFRTVHM